MGHPPGPLEDLNPPAKGLDVLIVWASVIAVFHFWIIPVISTIGKYEPQQWHKVEEEDATLTQTVVEWISGWVEL